MGTVSVPGVYDGSFGGGTLVLSELALRIPDTFCGKCYRGIVATGNVGGASSPMRDAILAKLGGADWVPSDQWSIRGRVNSTLVYGVPSGEKHVSVGDILNW